MLPLLRRLYPLVALTLLTPLPMFGDDTGHVVTAMVLRDPVIRLPISGNALVRQTVEVDLQEGSNVVSFAFGRLEIPLDTLELEVLSPSEAVAVRDMRIAPDSRDTVRWELAADEACRATLAIRHPLKGIEWRVEYAAVINRDAETLDISANAILTNNSKLEFAGARLEIPGGHEVVTDLKQSDTFQLPLFTATGVPCRSLFVYDPSRYGGSTTAVLRVLRDRGDRFSAGPLMAGKVRIYGPGAPAAYIGEDELPYLPPHESVDMKLGALPGVTVARKLVKSAQVGVKSDIRKKLVLFNQDDEVEFEVKNLCKSPVVLYIRDKIADDWAILRHSMPFEKIDAGTVEFVVSVQANETRKFTYVARRFNLQP